MTTKTRHYPATNEATVTGVAETEWGFTALTPYASKTFKTRAGAERWLARRGYNPDGSLSSVPRVSAVTK